MIDIRDKRLVKTRKEHPCFGCTEAIEKGKNAVACKGEQDGKPLSFHLHEECNKVIAKDKWFSGSGLYFGCIKDSRIEGLNLNLTKDEELPSIR